MVAFTRKHLSGALESGHKLCHYFRTETLARYNYPMFFALLPYEGKSSLNGLPDISSVF
jgi:hypothetical protein